MLKSTLIASCLHQCGKVGSVKEGELIVSKIFAEYFSTYSYTKWNTSLPLYVTEYFLRASKETESIMVDCFIQDLWKL